MKSSLYLWANEIMGYTYIITGHKMVEADNCINQILHGACNCSLSNLYKQLHINLKEAI